MKLGFLGEERLAVAFEIFVRGQDVVHADVVLIMDIDQFFRREVGHRPLGHHAVRTHRQDRDHGRAAFGAINVGQDLLLPFAEYAESLEVKRTGADRTTRIEADEMVRIKWWLLGRHRCFLEWPDHGPCL